MSLSYGIKKPNLIDEKMKTLDKNRLLQIKTDRQC